MLCRCSGQNAGTEECAPLSPESLATRDFSLQGQPGGASNGFGGRDDSYAVCTAESDLRQRLSLNYEEARALLGRLEFQQGNLDAALQVFRAIDIQGLKQTMIRVIEEKCSPKKSCPQNQSLSPASMSLHFVSLMLEAILLKAKALQGLGQARESARECKIIIDIVELAMPHGLPENVVEDWKLMEVFHNALELLPKLWIQANCLEEAILAYRRALIRPWNLDLQKSSMLQKDLSVLLLYGGVQFAVPEELQQLSYASIPITSRTQEAVLLLLNLMRRIAFQEISWDPDVLNHLVYALSICGHFSLLACNIEMLLPGTYSIVENCYVLALCYVAAKMDNDALNVLMISKSLLERKCRPHLPSFLLGAKLCAGNPKHASEGIEFASKAIECISNEQKDTLAIATHLLGVCYGHCARSSTFEFEKIGLQTHAIRLLQHSLTIDNRNSEILHSLALENAWQRNLTVATENAVQCLDMTARSSTSAWRLLILLLSAMQNFKEAEQVADIAIQETEKEDHFGLLRLKGQLQVSRGHAKGAIGTYRALLANIHGMTGTNELRPGNEVLAMRDIEMDAWLDLANIYQDLKLLPDSSICMDRAKYIECFSTKRWQALGSLLVKQSLHRDAIMAFSISLSIEPSYVPSIVSMAAAFRMLGGRSMMSIARSLVMGALRLEPTNHEAWLNLGLISKAEGSIHHAADCFQKAHDLKQSCPVASFM